MCKSADTIMGKLATPLRFFASVPVAAAVLPVAGGWIVHFLVPASELKQGGDAGASG